MKDLYKLLGIPSTSSKSSIRRAIENKSGLTQSERDDAAFVLLNQSRRATYDKYRSELIQVLEVRSRAKIQTTDNLFASGIHPGFAKTKYEKSSAHRSTTTHEGTQASNPLSGCLAVCVLAAVLVVIMIIMSSNTQTTTNRSSSHSQHPPKQTYTPPARPPQPQNSSDTYLKFAIKHLADQKVTGEAAAQAATKMREGRSDPLPKTGVLSRTDDWTGFAFGDQSGGYSPIEIITPRGVHYFIKVVDWNSSKAVLTAFIRGGDTFETLLPVGAYEIRYASGQSWYGKSLLFGPDASYARCDDQFIFTETYGHTIELIKQVGGNLGTENLSEDEF